MSQGDLSRVSDVSQAQISKLEGGLIDLQEGVVESLAEALHFPTSFFFQHDRVYGLPISVHPMYRKKASVAQRKLHRLEAELNIRQMHIRRLLKAAEFEGELVLPRLDIDEYGGDAKGVAELVRRTWLLPSGPLENLVDCVERAGCIVVHCDFSGLFVDGITIHQIPDLPPCIFLNQDQPADRQRFTLAHELGHIVMHRVPTPLMEDEANAFASALLLPASEIRPYVSGRLTLQRLASLKPMWRTSMGALLYCARTSGAITANQSQYLWRQMSAAGYRRREPPELDFVQEEPKVLPELLRVHLEDLGYDMVELSEALHIHEDELRQIHPIPGKQSGRFLRVVK